MQLTTGSCEGFFGCGTFAIWAAAKDSRPAAEVGRALPTTPPDANVNAEELEIENPNSKSATNDHSQLTNHDSSLDDFGGESVPVSPFESTREWLERQGIHVSKVLRGAR